MDNSHTPISDPSPLPDDPALRAIVETLRELPPENPEAVNRIVTDAMASSSAERSFGLGRPMGRWRVTAMLGSAAALFVVGLIVGHRIDSNNRSSRVMSSVVPTSVGVPVTAVRSARTNETPATELQRVPGGLVPTTFRLVAPQANHVAVVGDFNGWNPTANVLGRSTDAREWMGVIALPPGRHLYAFVVDGVVTPDPDVPSVRDPDYDVLASAIIVREP
jgi:hypothetical protein